MSSHQLMIIVLATTSAMAEAFGTMTVWKSFKTTAAVAAEIRRLLISDTDEAEAQAASPGFQWTGEVVGQTSRQVYEMRAKLASYLSPILNRLSGDRLTPWGLGAYIAGAGLGLAAAIVAVV